MSVSPQVPPVAQVSLVVVVVGATVVVVVVVVVVGAMVVVGAAVESGIRSFFLSFFLLNAPFLVRTAAVLSLLEFSLDPPQAASAIAATVSRANLLDLVLNLFIYERITFVDDGYITRSYSTHIPCYLA